MSENFWPILNSFAIFGLGTIVTVYLRRASAAAALVKEQQEWRRGIDEKMTTLMTQVSPLWAAVQSKIVKDLTHPHSQFKEMDALLVKLESLTITEDERERLHDLLRERSTSRDPEVNDEERASATLMIGVMGKVLAAAANPDPITNTITVGTSDRGHGEDGGKEEVKA